MHLQYTAPASSPDHGAQLMSLYARDRFPVVVLRSPTPASWRCVIDFETLETPSLLAPNFTNFRAIWTRRTCISTSGQLHGALQLPVILPRTQSGPTTVENRRRREPDQASTWRRIQKEVQAPMPAMVARKARVQDHLLVLQVADKIRS